jgi:hypothetical protein
MAPAADPDPSLKMLQRLGPRIDKASARYVAQGSAAEHCSLCRFFLPRGLCARVEGRVVPRGWCKFFSREMVQRHPGTSQVGGSGLPAGASLDLSFTQPTMLDPRVTFTRASTATYFNSVGTMQTAAVNAPRWDYNPSTLVLNGLLLEEQRINVLLNSATLGTQSVTVTAQAYTLSFYGTGTITKSGAAAGALVGTGAAQRVSQTFTPTAGSLTCTVTGTVTNAQLEAGAFPTSYIPTTAAAVTRAADQCGIPPANMGFYASPGGSWSAEFTPAIALSGGTAARIIATPTTGGVTVLYLNSSLQLSQYDGVGVAPTANALPTITSTGRAASTWTPGQASICLNGGAIASSATLTTGYGAFASGGIGFMTPSATSAENMTGYIRRVSYWPRVLTNAEMQSVTT